MSGPPSCSTGSEASERWRRLSDHRFQAAALDDARPSTVIRDVHDASGVLVDPHTAVGIGAARACRAGESPMVALATAHPAKFPDAVEQATGIRPDVPARLAELLDRPERCDVLPADVRAIRAHVLAAVS